ncbi:RES family NAD+ phosphorylase [Albimonas sp. CAU 1670]|uniref:RES family NAD+ phosphorylase n=1 Tax=Albimonas sp. CAU 1670 TaxID=3032599 RepID=UPI0023DA575D|nr:RES family NAD+ phosphorylase [Albimonas sp. CAU 1670]MDF2231236.1 RES family NAD+ phosphorylase [Albimonas sp. CAU 1670]
MSSTTWTPDALRSEARPLRATAWRMVEAQHVVSTLKLVDTLAEQAALEALLEETKPPVPPECEGLDYLLATPFRYKSYPHGSRFRRAGRTPGVFYAADRPETAMAEMAFYRLLFFVVESPASPLPDAPADFTAFAVPAATEASLDLRTGALAADAALWTDPVDYAACQALADAAREAGVEAIRYASVRDPAGGGALALLTCRAFAKPAPTRRESWKMRVIRTGVQALRESPSLRIDLPLSAFLGDPRLAAAVSAGGA